MDSLKPEFPSKLFEISNASGIVMEGTLVLCVKQRLQDKEEHFLSKCDFCCLFYVCTSAISKNMI